MQLIIESQIERNNAHCRQFSVMSTLTVEFTRSSVKLSNYRYIHVYTRYSNNASRSTKIQALVVHYKWSSFLVHNLMCLTLSFDKLQVLEHFTRLSLRHLRSFSVSSSSLVALSNSVLFSDLQILSMDILWMCVR